MIHSSIIPYDFRLSSCSTARIDEIRNVDSYLLKSILSLDPFEPLHDLL